MTGARLDEILRRGSLRFGLTADELPWSFRNSRGEIVGFEIDMAHALAVALEVRLELVPVAGPDRAQALVDGSCDFAVGRVRSDRARSMLFSRPLTHETFAFLVRDHQRGLCA